VALGIIQSDVLDFLRQSQDRQSLNIAERLGVIFPLYNEEVHLLARREITQVKDLQGKRVVVGVEGSGNWVTATYLLYLLGVEPGERLPLGPQEALEAVLANHTDAMFYVAGKPTPLFKELQQRGSGATDAVHFVSLANKTLQQKSYEPSTIGPQDYPWFSNTVETVAVKALLVGFDFSASDTLYARLRCDTLEKLSKIIRDHLSDLQSQGHPKWQQVKLDAELGPWKRHPCLLPASLRKLPLGIPPRSSR
jgi:TRAP transporter TAXI family solute receptor